MASHGLGARALAKGIDAPSSGIAVTMNLRQLETWGVRAQVRRAGAGATVTGYCYVAPCRSPAQAGTNLNWPPAGWQAEPPVAGLCAMAASTGS